MNLQRLCNGNLNAISAAVPVPTYDRSKLTPGIVHIGLGNFHRAHQSWYLHRLMQQGLNHDWAIIGAGVRPYDAEMREKMAAQDYLTTLIELGPDGSSAEVVGLDDRLCAGRGGQRPTDRPHGRPDIRIVALTVTEGGYYIDPATKRFRRGITRISCTTPPIPNSPARPSARWSRRCRLRRDSGIGPFTGQCCDNLQSQRRRCCARPSCRWRGCPTRNWPTGSTPTAPSPTRWSTASCRPPGRRNWHWCKEFGIDDAVPVTHENFRQWVIEDNFCAGRPDWDKAGGPVLRQGPRLRGAEDPHPQCRPPGDRERRPSCMGVETIAEIMAHPTAPRLLPQGCAAKRSCRMSVPVPGHDARAICRADRRAVRQPEDRRHHPPRRLRRLVAPPGLRSADGARRRSRPAPRSTGWRWSRPPGAGCAPAPARTAAVIEPNDPFWEALHERAELARERPRLWLEMRNTYGDLADDSRFADAFTDWLTRLLADGLASTLDRYLAA